jgi:hypothetical protein
MTLHQKHQLTKQNLHFTFLGILCSVVARPIVRRLRRMPVVRVLHQPVLYNSVLVQHSDCHVNPDRLFHCYPCCDGCCRITVHKWRRQWAKRKSKFFNGDLSAYPEFRVLTLKLVYLP